MKSVFSIVIPGFNRPEPLRYTLRSAADAARRIAPAACEIILVDDGSTPPLAAQLAGFDPGHSVIHLRQENQGSIVARLAGLAAARGEFIVFLDSDDLVHPDKLRLHREALTDGADLSHDDTAIATLRSDSSASFAPGAVIAHRDDPAELLLIVQPLPHSPVYRRAWLLAALASPVVPPDRRMDSAGDVWLYYNLAPTPGRAVKVPAALTAIGSHEESRYSQHWEKLGVASLLLAESFMARCPATPATHNVRRLVGECAFNSWRRLPRDYPAPYLNRVLAVWRSAPRGGAAALGGPLFQLLSRLLGPATAGWILRRRNGTYAACRTLDVPAFSQLLAAMPPSPLLPS